MIKESGLLNGTLSGTLNGGLSEGLNEGLSAKKSTEKVRRKCGCEKKSLKLKLGESMIIMLEIPAFAGMTVECGGKCGGMAVLVTNPFVSLLLRHLPTQNTFLPFGEKFFDIQEKVAEVLGGVLAEQYSATLLLQNTFLPLGSNLANGWRLIGN